MAIDTTTSVDVQTLTPFKKFIMTIGTLPTSYLESMTYAELVMWFCNYLQEQVIPTVNNNAEAITETEQKIIDVYNELKYYVDHYFDDFDIQTEVDNKLDEYAEDGTLTSLLQSFQISKTNIDINSKTNLLDAAVWNITSGWSGSNGHFVHTTGNSTALTTNIDVTNYACYVLKFTCTNQYANNANPPLIAEFSTSGTFEQYNGDGTTTKWFTFYPTDDNGILKFTPNTSWTGDVYDIKLVKLESTDLLEPTLNIYDENDHSCFSVIATNKEMHNISISDTSLQKATLGAIENVAIGHDALSSTATGYFNVAIGSNSQKDSVNGSRNIGIGYESLGHLVNGDRNIAVGTFALENITNGRDNIGIGADAGWHTTSGSYNIAMGGSSLDANTTGSNNIALGYLTNSRNTTGSDNISIGYFSHYKGDTDSHNISIGWQSMMGSTRSTGDATYTNNIALGYESMFNPKGSGNVAIGYDTLKSPSNTTNKNVAIGYDVMSSTVACTGDSYNVIIGGNIGKKVAGNYNVGIGVSSLNGACGDNNIALGLATLANSTGSENIAIGHTAGNAVTTGTNNVLIGYRAGLNVTTASNCVILGTSQQGHNADGEVILGNAIAYTGTSLNRMGICGAGASGNSFLNIPAGTATNAPLRLNSGTLLTTPGSGCIEYDGTHLYFTDASNNRHQISVDS